MILVIVEVKRSLKSAVENNQKFEVNVKSFVFLILIFLTLNSFAKENDGGLWVTGTGEVSVTPDLAILSFSVSTLNKSANESQKENATIAQKVVSKVKKLGIAGKDLQSSNFSVNAEYDYKDRTRVLKGHRVQHSYNVIIRKISMLGDVLDGVTEVGQDSVSIGQISFGLSNDEELKLKSLEASVHNAKTKAQAIAKAAGKKLGDLTFIDENVSSGAVPVARMEMMKSMSADASTEIQSGEVGVISKVRVHFNFD
ncbi:MAG: hypothetical protein COW01_01925 [Bdellovibrionales bacterium CG12_big_fil_rev_8_21_14_0_65_38_15]|nr:MAG: hypothetical protein COW79_02160 [Bdellovibrionales bacterium CG22_combo_CG10-13_8_21_14_all_38_13]PIQ57065.1 MAG: hypothetical protein COW01_01925 [Bdellovibrionales bacterium CG12_big_fil_rev_8_21_14_0_65_38_15]PIR30095.1 MAG: hypothetical protein COV38_07320 [Bdellovibrionales bacterium CG11_big_fil_rev_8_21_14_0_20_38_13]